MSVVKMVRTCSINRCANSHLAKGMCSSHYQYLARHSSFEGYDERLSVRQRYRRGVSIEDFVCSNIKITEACWEWTGSKNVRGYAQFVYEGKKYRAYRLVYEMFVGPIPPGLVTDHLCENRECVNPFHLEPVTSAENVRRAAINKNGTHTNCKRGHKWTPETTAYHSTLGYRNCRKCNVINVRNQRMKRRMELCGY